MAFRIKPKSEVNNSEIRKTKIVGEIRKSQSISTYGPGSLIDFPRMSGIIEGIDNWETTLGNANFNKMKIHERNLEKILGKRYFIQPQIVGDKYNFSNKFINGINARRFPEYCYCPECGILDRYYKIAKKANNSSDYNNDIYCGLCNQTKNRNVKLIPSRFVVACACGHMDDFPYEWWVHRKTGRCANPKLTIEISKNTNSTEGIVIKCQCKAEENLGDIMDKGSLHQLRCFGAMPWLGRTEDNRAWYSEYTREEPCEKELVVLQRGANNVYYPNIVSALTIPPFSSRIQKILSKDIELLTDYYHKPEQLKKANLDYYYEVNEKRLKCDMEQFYYELDYALGIAGNGYKEISDLVKGEYDALCEEECNDPDFLTINSPVPNEFDEYISQIKIVGRLRVVEVLDGFKRISHEESEKAQLSKKTLSWLPANELFGEGIFICLNEEKVKEWEESNINTYHELITRAKNNFFAAEHVDDNNIRYILLHTFAHLLIRELTLQSGYTSASLKERIYSSKSGEKNMCGILIYTASSDSDGSLGGLARQGVTEKIRKIFFSMLEEASWCSNDPICIDSRAQGYALLNRAACHACTLLPETSCECSNILLDRGAIIGSSENKQTGYFGKLIQEI